jgi:hypothetical protein
MQFQHLQQELVNNKGKIYREAPHGCALRAAVLRD